MFNCIEGTGLHFDPSLTGISREIERFPMDRRKAKTVDGLLMRRGWITFMLLKSIVGENLIINS